MTKKYPHGKIFAYVARYIDALPDLSGKVVVDIPCGDGRASESFARKGATIKAFDLYPEFNKADGITAQHADMGEPLPLDDESVDYLVCLEGAEHMPDKISLFREFNRVLKKDGTLILTLPSVSNARARMSMLLVESELWRRTAPTELDSVWFSDTHSDRLYFGHLFLVSVQHLMTICTLTGFRVSKRIHTRISSTSVVLGILLYPLLIIGSLLSYFLYRKKLTHVEPATRNRILWERVKLNLSPTVVFSKHVFWVLQKSSNQADTLEMLRDLTRGNE